MRWCSMVVCNTFWELLQMQVKVKVLIGISVGSHHHHPILTQLVGSFKAWVCAQIKFETNFKLGESATSWVDAAADWPDNRIKLESEWVHSSEDFPNIPLFMICATKIMELQILLRKISQATSDLIRFPPIFTATNQSLQREETFILNIFILNLMVLWVIILLLTAYRVSQKKPTFRTFLRHSVIPTGLTG